jgi:hypothetical protein
MAFNSIPVTPSFTHLQAHILQEHGAFTVSVRMHNHLTAGDRAYGVETAASIEMASTMIGQLARQFSIPEASISINIVMNNSKDGTLH